MIQKVRKNPTLVIATGNMHKLREIESLMRDAGLSVQIRPMTAYGKPPTIVESASTFDGNAQLKAEGIASWLIEQNADVDWVLADDSGICVDALDGAPGVISARFAGEHATDAQNNLKMVDVLRALHVESSPAHYECVLAICRVQPAPETRFYRGAAYGEIRVQARGNGGFGYDPHFWIEDRTRTYAELKPEEKARLGHRGAALRQLVEALPALLNGEFTE